MQNLYFDEIIPWNEPRKETLPKLAERFPKADSSFVSPLMSEGESAFLCGLLKKCCPHKILEVGVASGATTAIILRAMTELRPEGFEMISVDYLEYYYLNDEFKCGFLGDVGKELLADEGKNFSHKWLLGNVACAYEKELGNDIDFLILDAAHVLPGELLDFITLLPCLKDGTTVVLHDISHNHDDNRLELSFATGALFSAVSTEKRFINRDISRRTPYPNIGAFIVNQDTRENILNLFLSLFLTWGSLPSKRQLDAYRAAVKKWYPEEMLQIFEYAVELNIERSTENIRFPFEVLQNGARVVIYGGGRVGQAYLKQLEQGHYNCVLAGYIDRHNVDEIRSMEYDFVIVSNREAKNVAEIKETLIECGVDEGKIVSLG